MVNKKITYITWVVLLTITVGSLFFAFNDSENMNVIHQPENIIETKEIPGFDDANFFMNNVSQCQNTASVSEQFFCLYQLAEVTEKEANILAEKLISQASIRLEEINTEKIGPVSFVYGGADFLTALPVQVSKAQQVKDEYIKSICNLTSMTIFGGSGMDLEQNACKYYFNNEYIQILKSLERGLIVVE